jgi:hypothetical protein
VSDHHLKGSIHKTSYDKLTIIIGVRVLYQQTYGITPPPPCSKNDYKIVVKGFLNATLEPLTTRGADSLKSRKTILQNCSVHLERLKPELSSIQPQLQLE